MIRLFCFVLLLYNSVTSSSAIPMHTFYMSSNNDPAGRVSPCGAIITQPCSNFEEVFSTAIHSGQWIGGIEFVFLPGLYLVTEQSLATETANKVFRNATRFRFIGTNRLNTSLTCLGSAMRFSDFNDFEIKGLTVTSCDLHVRNGSRILISNSAFLNSYKFALQFTNSRDSIVVIEDTDVVGSSDFRYQSPGVQAVFNGNGSGKMLVSRSRFINLSSTLGAGLSVFLSNESHDFVVTVSSSNFTGNQATNASAVYVQTADVVTNFSINIVSCRFSNNTAEKAAESHGGAIGANFTGHTTGSFSVVDSAFVNNSADHGAALLIVFNDDSTNIKTELINCLFDSNTVGGSGTVTVYSVLSASVFPQPSVFRNVTFVGNYIKGSFTDRQLKVGSALTVFGMTIVFEGDVHFFRNSNTSVFLMLAVLRIKDTAIFRNNSGRLGGALHLYEDATIELYDSAKVQFVDNVAYSGGAIFVARSGFRIWTEVLGSALRGHRCFFSPYPSYDPKTKKHKPWILASVNFTNNKADREGGGGAVWAGQSIRQRCPPAVSGQEPLHYDAFNYSNNEPADVQWDVVNTIRACLTYPGSTSHTSQYCNETVNVYPGIQHRLKVYVTDVKDLGVTADLFVQTKEKSVNLSSFHNQALGGESVTEISVKTQLNGTSSQHLYFSGKGQTEIRVYSKLDETRESTFKVIVAPGCPVGYVLNDDLRVCECDNKNKSFLIECKSEGKFRPLAGYWVGPSPDDASKTIGSWCPVEYCHCRGDSCWIDARSPNDQCAEGRKGALCGECDSSRNYSASFGAMYPKCLLKCGDEYRWEIPLMIVISFVVVAFAVVINLDVTSGPLRPFTLYFQISVVALAYSKPDGLLSRGWIHYLAWIPNLNFRVNTCLWSGLKTLEGVVFLYFSPLCVFAFMGIFVFLARRFTHVSRVHMLRPFCSLLTLTYVIITYTTFMLLHCVDLGGSRRRWYNDGSVVCFGPEHLPYGIVAIIVAAVYVIPLPFFLAFGLPRINRLKPFVDIFIHQFRKQYSWGEGLNFGRRLALVVVHCFSGSPQFRQTLVLVVGVSLLGLHGFLQPYTDPNLNTLETVLLANFCILGILQCYTNSPLTVTVSIVVYCLPIGLALIYFLRFLTLKLRARFGKQTDEVQNKKRRQTASSTDAEDGQVMLRTMSENVKDHRQTLTRSGASYDNDELMDEHKGGLRERLLDGPTDEHQQ